MIEVIYKEEKQEAKGNEALFHIPRNIRQIGLVSESYRIYIEDYVYTFLGRLAGSEQAKESGGGCLAVLVGDTNWSEGTTYLFIRGALLVEDMEAAADHIDFTDEIWKRIHEEADKYFPEQEIMGWFFSQPQLPIEMTELFGRVHLKHFGGEKVLMLMEPVEREDAFFRYENNYMVRQSGYYIYYEKNPQMQAYMIEKNQDIKPDLTEEVEDEAVKTFRKIIKAKKKEEPEETEERPSVFSYAATACLAIAVLAVGVNFYQNYRDMQSVRQQSEAVSAVIKETDVAGITPLPSKGAGGGDGGTQGKSAGEQGTAEKDSTMDGASQDTAGAGQLVGLQDDGTASGGASASGDSSGGTSDSGDSSGGASASGDSSGGASASGNSSGGASDGSAGASTQTGSQQTTGEQVQNSDVYKEESDVRKARRRAALAAQENKAAAGQNSSTAEGGNTRQGASSSDSQDQTTSGSDVHESYVIRPGDTLFQISMARYGGMEAIEEICRLNGISEDEIIYPGQVIVLP